MHVLWSPNRRDFGLELHFWLPVIPNLCLIHLSTSGMDEYGLDWDTRGSLLLSCLFWCVQDVVSLVASEAGSAAAGVHKVQGRCTWAPSLTLSFHLSATSLFYLHFLSISLFLRRLTDWIRLQFSQFMMIRWISVALSAVFSRSRCFGRDDEASLNWFSRREFYFSFSLFTLHPQPASLFTHSTFVSLTFHPASHQEHAFSVNSLLEL